MQELCIVNHTIIYLFIDIWYYFKIDSEIDVQIDLKKRSSEPKGNIFQYKSATEEIIWKMIPE